LHAQAIKERDEARREFGFLYDAVSDAEKVDTNAGDSAVSVVLWSFAERRSLLAGVPGGSGQGVEGLLSEDDRCCSSQKIKRVATGAGRL
jgi:hypothetical protein